MLEGEARATIVGEMVRLHREYYGRGPTKARAHMTGDMLVVLMEEGLHARRERTLIEHGEADGIQDIRRRFQRVMRHQFVSIVEQATGRQVRSFFSDTDLTEEISIELFLLAEQRTDTPTSSHQTNRTSTAACIEPFLGRKFAGTRQLPSEVSMSEFDRGPSAQLAELFDRVPDPLVKKDFWFDWGPYSPSSG